MEYVIREFLASNFERTSLPLSHPLVIHAVAGAGKTFILRRICETFPDIEVQTKGVPDSPQVSGNFIRPFTSFSSSSRVKILDEYLASADEGNADILCADPLQYPSFTRKPHLICTKSRRIGVNTAKLLRSLGIQIEGSHTDKIQVHQIFEADPKFPCFAWEPEVRELLNNWQVECRCPKDILGITVPAATVVIDDFEVTAENKYKLYICLSRHTTHLQLLVSDPDQIPVEVTAHAT